MMNSEAFLLLQNGVRLEQQGRLMEAEECFTSGIVRIRVLLQSGELGNSQKLVLTEYIQNAAQSIQRIRSRQRTTSSASANSTSQTAADHTRAFIPEEKIPPGQSGVHAGKKNSVDDDYLNFLDDAKYRQPDIHTDMTGMRRNSQSLSSPSSKASHAHSPNQQMSKPPPPPPKKKKSITPLPQDEDGSAAAGATKPPPGSCPPPHPSSSAPPPPLSPSATSISQPSKASKGSLADYFAPRTSDLVLKAIDVATTLAQQQELKRAVDVLQHAYVVGKRERNNPSNFDRIGDMLLFMRREYYNRFKPRFLQDNPVLPEEMEVLRKSGITSTILLPIWDDVREGYCAENVFMPCEGHWEDSFTPRLSAVQQKCGARYLRAEELRKELSIIHTANPLNIIQTVVGDCSMVCSLIVCASYQQRFPKAKIINNVIFPQDKNGDPIVNPKGKYCVKMLVNGATRLITVDDRFPANPSTKELLCTYSRDKTELWVSIMEKAFVKVCGGSYDFPGSSSASDLYKLSGWLPDSVTIHGEGFNSEREWARLSKRHTDGSVILSASTDTLPEEDTQNLLLASEHAYAVLAMRDVSGVRLVQIMNPWSKRSWGGSYSIYDKRPEAMALRNELEYTEDQADLGIFWITWEDLQRHFARFSLSWNPYLLFKTSDGMAQRPTRLACHGHFPYTLSVGQMPQFHLGVVNAPRPSRMHLVISRHIVDLEAFRHQFQSSSPEVPYIGIKVYDVTAYPSIAQNLGARCNFGMCYCRRLAHGSELRVPFEPLNTFVYRNMAAHTASFDCPAGTRNLLVVVARTSSSIKTGFSFSLTLHTEWPQLKFSESLSQDVSSGEGAGIVFMHAVPTSILKHTTVRKSSWVKGVSCGGRSDSQTFVYNPQFLLKLSKPSMLSVRLSVPESDLSSNVHIIRRVYDSAHERVPWSARVGSMQSSLGNIMLQGPLYSHDGALVDTSLRRTLTLDKDRLFGEDASSPLSPLPEGDYVIIPALWERGQPADYELVVESTEPHTLEEIPAEGVGFTESTIAAELPGRESGGARISSRIVPRTDAFFANPRVSVTAASAGIVTCRLLQVLKGKEEAVGTNLSLFRAKDATTMELVASSGSFAVNGTLLPAVRIEPNVVYIMVVSPLKASRNKYILRFYSNCGIKPQLV